MGGGAWTPSAWTDYSTKHVAGKSTDAVFKSKTLVNELDPKDVKVRESRDSVDNPASTAIIIGVDVTGSMGMIADALVREGLNTLCTELYDRKPVSDPHIMCMGIGDAEAGDKAPLQVTQFEADIRIADQLTKIYLEKGGGGNQFEGYTMPWYFAAMHTSIDCFEKRGKKAFLFTVGDEEPPARIRAVDIERVLGYSPQADISTEDLLTMVSRNYEVFHLMVEETANMRRNGTVIKEKWTNLLGQRALLLADHTKFAEVIVSAIQIVEGANAVDVAKSWDGSTSLTVAKAVSGLTASDATGGAAVVRL